jgi:hypothetical protein
MDTTRKRSTFIAAICSATAAAAQLGMLVSAS